MNLAEFVEESLSEILVGIKAAQSKEGGGAVGAELAGAPPPGSQLFSSGYGSFTIVDFDVSVVAETQTAGKAGIRVWSIGAEGGGQHSSQQSSRIRFSVHLRIPDGDRHKAVQYPRADRQVL